MYTSAENMPKCSLILCSATILSSEFLGGQDIAMPRKNPYERLVLSLFADGFDTLAQAVSERRCCDRYRFGTFTETAALYRPHPLCPRCGFSGPDKGDVSASNLQRLEGGRCGYRFSSSTGTALEHSKEDMPTWVGFINLMRVSVPLERMATSCTVSHPTAFEWRHRVFETADGYQDRLALCGCIWIDETYVNDIDLPHDYGETRKRDPSRRKVCIATAINAFKSPVAIVCGHGKPSSKRMKVALLSHRVPSPCRGWQGEGTCPSSRQWGVPTWHTRPTCRTRTTSRRWAMANSLCSWIKRYLWRFIGMDPAIVLELVRLFVQGKSDKGQMARNGKCGSPFVTEPGGLSQLDGKMEALVFIPVRKLNCGFTICFYK